MSPHHTTPSSAVGPLKVTLLMNQLNAAELLDEARDNLLDAISIIEAYESEHFSNDLEREQALDSFCAWARGFVRRTSPTPTSPKEANDE